MVGVGVSVMTKSARVAAMDDALIMENKLIKCLHELIKWKGSTLGSSLVLNINVMTHSIMAPIGWYNAWNYRMLFETIAGAKVVVADKSKWKCSVKNTCMNPGPQLLASPLQLSFLHLRISTWSTLSVMPIDALCVLEPPFAFMSSQQPARWYTIWLYDEWVKCWHLCYSYYNTRLS